MTESLHLTGIVVQRKQIEVDVSGLCAMDADVADCYRTRFW